MELTTKHTKKKWDISDGIYTLELFEKHLENNIDEKLKSGIRNSILYCATGIVPVSVYLLGEGKENRKKRILHAFENSKIFKFVHSGDSFYYFINIESAIVKISQNSEVFPAEALLYPQNWVVNFMEVNGNQIDKPNTTINTMNLLRKLLLLGVPYSSAVNTVIFKFIRSKVNRNVGYFDDDMINKINMILHKRIDLVNYSPNEYSEIFENIINTVDLDENEIWLLKYAHKINKDRDYYVFHAEDRDYLDEQRNKLKQIRRLYKDKLSQSEKYAFQMESQPILNKTP